MKLIAGLGNPGDKYQGTRHNVGFDVVEQLAAVNQGAWQTKFASQFADVLVGGEKVLLLKPGTYMNRSGEPVRAAVDFYKIAIPDILVICDDFSLPLGRLRLRPKGSSGGQNGLKDIFKHLATEEVGRLRLGIGDPGRQDPADFVLSRFAKGEADLVRDVIIEAVRAAETWVRDGMATAMNEFNGLDLTA